MLACVKFGLIPIPAVQDTHLMVWSLLSSITGVNQVQLTQWDTELSVHPLDSSGFVNFTVYRAAAPFSESQRLLLPVLRLLRRLLE
jgi:hypothetical protein